MKRKLKGFTLIECLVALAILGIASLTMAQIYAGVARTNMTNHQYNTSISNQEQFIEKELKDNGAVEVKYNGLSDPTATNPAPPHSLDSNNQPTTSFVEISDGTNTFSYPVDIYILRSRDRNDKPSYSKSPVAGDPDIATPGYSGPDETKTSLKYRYFLAH